MEERDAIVWWLEQGDNFLRVTASSPFSSSSRRGRVNLRDVVQAESQALNELAAFVNRNIPGSNWDPQHAKQMLRHYMLEYRSTAEAAANPQFILDEKDELLGIQTVQAKLNAMCLHFQRLQQLHDPVTIATRERERKRMERGGENEQSNGQRQKQPTATPTTYVKVHVDLTETQGSEREEVVPESDLSNSNENSETDREAASKVLCSNSTVTETVDKVQQGASKPTVQQLVERIQHVEGNKVESVSKSKISKEKTKVTAAKKTQAQKKQEKSQKQSKVTPATPMVAQASYEKEEDETLPTSRSSTPAKKRSTRSAVNKDEGKSPRTKKKQRHAETPSGTKVHVVDLTLSQTTQEATSSASEGSQDSLLNDENTVNGTTHGGMKLFSGNKRKIIRTSKPTQVANGLPSSSSVQATEPPTHRNQLAKDGASLPTSHSSSHQKSTQSTVVSDALRSAIAQVVSQRQQLLSRQRSRSYSDSDIDTPAVDLKSRASSKADTPRSRYEPVPSAGFLPPLIVRAKTISAKSNMERKRAFFRAKELAFEQLKWQRENELQQLELHLLRREMEARQSLAQQELKLQRMRMRADLIQPMLSAGASVAEVAARLRLL